MQSFHEFASANGVLIDGIVRGKIVRCQTETHKHKKNGAYFFCEDFGWIHNWEIHSEPVFWKDETKRTTEQQKAIDDRMAKSRDEYARNRAKAAQEAARRAQWILGNCELTTHKYIQRKGFKELPVNVWQKDEQQLLIVPMYHKKAICGCQIINDDGDKKFLAGQRTSGAHFKIGDGKQIFLTEGFASGLSLQAILASIGCPSTIYVTFSVGNATKMAKYLPTAKWIADHDASGAGQNAAEASGLRWWMPEEVGHDVNDAYIAQGKLRTGMQIKKFLIEANK